MPDTCRRCDFFLDRGLASASSPPSKKSDVNTGICWRHVPQIKPGSSVDGRAIFPTIHADHWCGEFQNRALLESPC
ncbi:hypothetical protein ACFSTI_29425 [Rhizorhabdus histidinilytica]|uniref:Uncharacterized protein n=1 Tax=Rhizorhabdus histidinilytica TaxID=439228 RepID=A0A1T5CIR0_9SPHN|nr:hypothetical protein [Rhizorhabdus histidinilytica]SKB59030.1 hypothetical protein SAMN06295920_10475 [Rhizorhabdus histidinilytica]